MATTPSDEVAAELESLSDRIDALSEDTERWLPEDIAIAGAVIGIGYGGKLAAERGLVRPEDKPDESGESIAAPRRGRDEQGLSDKLVENLTTHRTAAIRVELAGKTDIALTAVVHALAAPAFFPHETESCLEILLDSAPLHGNAEGIEDSAAARALAERHAGWRRRLPNTAEALWDWLLAQDTATRLELLAYCAGCSINAVRKRHDRADSDRLAHADRLTTALGLDMTQWWQPTSAGYFRQVPKARILDAVREGHSLEAAENLSKLKKDALAAEAEQRLVGSGWLPGILRTPKPAEPVLEALGAE